MLFKTLSIIFYSEEKYYVVTLIKFGDYIKRDIRKIKTKYQLMEKY